MPPEAPPKIILQHVETIGLPTVKKGEVPIKHAGYTVLFDKTKHVPKWFFYHMTKQLTATKAATRSNRFHSDPLVDGCPDPSEYKKSGYDRGHMAPAEDMRWSAESEYDSFSMANMTPQAPKFNRGIWKRLEEKVRAWELQYDDVYVVTWPVLSEPCAKTIGHGACVPARHFKVVLEKDGDKIKIVGFIVPQEGKGDPSAYEKPASEIRKMTGINFFPSVSDAKATAQSNR